MSTEDIQQIPNETAGREYEPGQKFDEDFLIRKKLGAGGFGVVYEAEQIALRRLVALKLVFRANDDSWARFESEAQALALIEHTNIARLFDARRTPEGIPYLVMEFVRGESIDDYCDRKLMEVRGRVRLFVSVCRAVAHCHQKGFVHGDLHPRNILVAGENEKPLVKIIDFGLVEALGKPLVDGSRLLERPAGVFAYISPEKVSSPFGQDARSDVFSLGAVLYRLLTGFPARDPELLNSSGINECLKLPIPVASEKFERSRKSSESETLVAASIAQERDTTPYFLTRQLRGDVDSILGCCLAIDQDARYRDSDELAEDLEAFLENRPLRAKRKEAGYSLHVVKKWSARHPAVIVAIVGVSIGILLRSTGLGEKVIAASGGILAGGVIREIVAIIKAILTHLR